MNICSHCTTIENWVLLGIGALIVISVLAMFYLMFVALPRALFPDE